VEDVINNNPAPPTLSRTKHPGGRPTEYKAEYNEQVYKFCLLGATDAEIADIFGVDERTINDWKIKYPEFSQSLRAGKVEADANVGKSLYQIATGYEHPEDVIMQYQGKPVIVPTTRHYPPDYKAASLWLRNRRPDRWREQQDISITESITVNIGELPAADVILSRIEARRAERNVTPELPEKAVDSGDA
jgi:hypothetical protein